MAFDLLVRNAALPDGRAGLDIAAKDGRIVGIAPETRRRGAMSRSTPRAGSFRRPSSIAISIWTRRLSLGLPRLNRSGTLLEGIALWGELKPLLTHEARRRARACAIATSPCSKACSPCARHVDVCDDRLVGVEALLDVRSG